jgi:hypothetical protein
MDIRQALEAAYGHRLAEAVREGDAATITRCQQALAELDTLVGRLPRVLPALTAADRGVGPHHDRHPRAS